MKTISAGHVPAMLGANGSSGCEHIFRLIFKIDRHSVHAPHDKYSKTCTVASSLTVINHKSGLYLQ